MIGMFVCPCLTFNILHYGQFFLVFVFLLHLLRGFWSDHGRCWLVQYLRGPGKGFLPSAYIFGFLVRAIIAHFGTASTLILNTYYFGNLDFYFLDLFFIFCWGLVTLLTHPTHIIFVLAQFIYFYLLGWCCRTVYCCLFFCISSAEFFLF